MTRNWIGLFFKALLAIIVMFLANLVRVPLATLPGMQEETSRALLFNSLTFVITFLVVAVFVALWTRYVEKNPFDFQWSKAWGLVGGTAVVAVPMVASWLVLPATTVDSPRPDATMVGALVIFLVVRSYILQGIPEELLFRGWLFSLTQQRPLVTVVWTTIAFTLPHLLSSGGQQDIGDHFLYLVLPLGMGFLAGAVVVWKGNFWWAAGTHGGMHAVMGLLGALFPVELGARAWVVIGIAHMVTAAVVLAWAYRRSREVPIQG